MWERSVMVEGGKWEKIKSNVITDHGKADVHDIL